MPRKPWPLLLDHYSPEFKQGAVGQVRQPGVSCAQIARELGVAPNLLSRWKREADAQCQKAFGGTGKPRDEEMAQLKRELARVKKERDFLREAATFFAKESSWGTRRFNVVAMNFLCA